MERLRGRTILLTVVTLLAVLLLIPSVVPSQNIPLWFSKGMDRVGLFKKIQLGLDLQGGSHFVYRIDLDKAVEDKATEIRRDIETKLEEMKLAGRVKTPARPLGAVTVTMANADDKARIDEKFLADYDEIVVRRDCPAEDDAAKSVCLRVSSDYADRIKKSALEQAIETVRERIDEKGVAEPTVIQKDEQIIVELPGLEESYVKEVKDLIERTAKLEFKIVQHAQERNGGQYQTVDDFMFRVHKYVSEDPAAKALGIKAESTNWAHRETGKEFVDYYLQIDDKPRIEQLTPAAAKQRGCYRSDMKEVGGKVECEISARVTLQDYLAKAGEKQPDLVPDDEHEFGYEPSEYVVDKQKKKVWRTYYLRRAVELGGTAVTDARVIFNPTTTRPEVLVNFNRWGGRRFGELTGENVGHKMAIILDDKVASAPVIQTRIDGGSSQITMGGGSSAEAQKEAQALVNVLRTGSLPAPLREDSYSEVGPLLGQDAIAKARLSFVLGTVLVILLMIVYYRFSGMIAIAALILNILYTLAAMSAIGATLTLPGIAALVLTVGMAVDSNIIIYERIREELRAGKSPRGAADAGFQRGFAAIVDGHLTTGAAAYVLYQFGSGPIRGFAVMLMIGIVVNIWTGTWVSRLFYDYYLGKGRKALTVSI